MTDQCSCGQWVIRETPNHVWPRKWEQLGLRGRHQGQQCYCWSCHSELTFTEDGTPRAEPMVPAVVPETCPKCQRINCEAHLDGLEIVADKLARGIEVWHRKASWSEVRLRAERLIEVCVTMEAALAAEGDGDD